MRRGLVFALSFVLLFSVSTLAEPLSEGFEGTFPPDDWTIIQGPCSPTNDIIQTSDEAHTGTYSLRFSSYYSCGDGYDEYIITPRLDVTSGDQTISFWYKKYSSGTEVFNVGWSSTGTDVSTDFTWTEDITDATTDWQQYTKTDLPVGTKYVAVHYHSNFSYYLYIDDFAGPELYVSTDSVDWCNLQWPPSDTITEGDDFWVYAQCWEDGVTNYPGPGTGIESWIGWSDADIAPNSWTNWEPGTYNTDVDNNDEYKANLGAILSPGAYYYASRFRLNDGPYTYGGYSAGGGGFWDGTTYVSGYLLVNPFVVNTFPWTEGFEDETFPPAHWSTMGTGWDRTTSYYHTGDASAMCNWTAGNWLITPAIDLSGGDYRLTFWGRHYSSPSGEFNVVVSENADMSDSTVIESWANIYTDWTDEFQPFTISLSAYSDTVYIGFNFESLYGCKAIIDDITIEEIPTTPQIVISQDTFDIGFVEVGTTDSVEIIISNTGGADLVITSATVSAPFSCTYSGTIAPGESDTTYGYFSPTSTGDYSEELTFNIDGAFTGDNSCQLEGYGYPAGLVCQDFTETDFPPAGWDTLNFTDYASDGWSRYESSTYSRSLPACAKGNPGTDSTNFWLVTPRLSVRTGDIMFFWYRTESAIYDESFAVYITTGSDWRDTTGYTQIWDSGIINNTTYQSQVLSLSAYEGQEVYIAFKHYYGESGSWFLFLDDIYHPPIYVSPDEVDWCNLQHPPSDTITEGDDFWVYARCWEDGVTNYPGPGTGIESWIGWSDADIAPNSWTNWEPGTYNTDVDNNDEYKANLGAILSPGAYYYASRFRLNDGPYTYGGYSAGGGGFWDGTTYVSGYLLVNPFVVNTFPWTEGFEDETFPPAHWSTMGTGWDRTTSYYHTGDASAMCNWTAGNWLITPAIDLSGGDYRLTFWGRHYSSPSGEFNVVVSENADMSDSTVIESWANIYTDWTDEFQPFTISLSAYSDTVYIGFNFESLYGCKAIIDDITIEEIPTTPQIVISQDTFDIGFVEVGTTDSVEIIISNTGGADLVITSATVSAPFSCTYSGTIAPGESDTTYGYFSPTSTGDYSEELTFNIDGAFTGDNSCQLEGYGYPAGALFESFENETFPPEGWSTATDVPGKEWERSTSYSYHEDASAKAPWSSSGVTADLTTPQILPEVDDSISFYLRGNSYSSCTLRVIADDITDGTTDTLDKICTGFGTDWTRFAYDLSTYDGDVVTITFSQEDHNGFYVYLDCVTGPMIYVPPIDVSPTDLFFSSPPMTGEDVDVSLEVVNIGTDVPDSIIIEFGKGASVYLIDTLVGVFATPDTDTVAFTHSWTVSDSFLNDYWAMATAYYPVDENVGNDTLTSSVFVLPTGIVMYEDFEDDWSDTAGIAPPGPWEIYPGWNVWDYGDAADAWNGNDWHRLSPTKSEVTNGTNVASVWYSPVENQDEWLVSPSIEGNAHTTWLVGLWMNYDDFGLSDSDTGFVDITTDGGTSWSNIATFTEDILDTDTSFDISSLVAYHWFQIRFRYVGDNAWGWQVDNVMIRGFGPAEVGEENAVVKQFSLGNAYPNPFNPTVTISYALKGCSSDIYKVELDVYNLLGKKVRTLVSCEQSGGRYRIIWDGKDEVGNTVPSGVYLYRLKAGDFVSTKKMMMLK